MPNGGLLRGPRRMLIVCGAFAAACSLKDGASTEPGREPRPTCAANDASRPKPAAGPITVVHVEPSAPSPVQLAVQACAGLHNRSAGGSVYVDADPHDLV